MLKSFILSILFFSFLDFASAQLRYVVLEKIGKKRIRLVEGDELHFKLKGETAFFHDAIVGFGDSTLLISSGIRIHIKDISSIYRQRRSFDAIRVSMQSLGIGFIIFPTLNYLANSDGYKPTESIIIGITTIGLAQLLKLAPKWKRFNLEKTARIWIYE